MKIMLTGAAGQLGKELQRIQPTDHELLPFTHAELDITNQAQVMERAMHLRPDLIINAAAYNAVDAAETDIAPAMAVNAEGTKNLAQAAAELGVRFIHVSTDYVFDGNQGKPYLTSASTNPLSAYGRSKQAGEQFALAYAPDKAVIVRTSWVYASHGKNFVNTILRLLKEREHLGVIADQIGSPTWANTLAKAIWQMVSRPQLAGIFHWTDAGVTSWYDFACAIQEEALSLGLIQRAKPIKPLTTADYPLPAPRPHYSVLDKTSSWQALELYGIHWRVALRAMLEELPRA